MLEFLKSPNDVIAIKIAGKLDAAEFDALVERIEGAIEGRDKTHMYMEVEGFSGFDLEAFAHYLPRGLAMLGKLDRFGRIAVVADQRWVRAWTRIESALLPGISYEIFMPEERDVALAWVEGRRDRPHEPAIRIIETDSEDVIGFELNGKLDVEDVEAAAANFERAFESGRPLRILGRIKRIGGVEPGALFSSEYVRMKMHALQRVERYALVGGPTWLRAWVTMIDPLFRIEVRHFPADQEEAAWSWLGARPKAERPLAA